MPRLQPPPDLILDRTPTTTDNHRHHNLLESTKCCDDRLRPPGCSAWQARVDSLRAMARVTVRPATIDDASAIRSIGEATWPVTYSFAGEEYIAHGLKSWWSDEATLHSLQTTANFVAERDGAVIGMGNIDLRAEPSVIWKLYVLPDHHGTGAGHALLEALLDVPPDGGGVALEYTEGNERAARFYRRHGFVEWRRDPGEQPGWPDQVWMFRPT
jgi:GNAT superfamily N-acetyltransferase